MTGFSLKLLGGFALRSAEGEEIRIPSRKTRGLLAYLSLSGDQPVRRERLAGLLWSEKPERRARHSLTQSLSELRSSLSNFGDAPLVTTRDGVRVDTALIRVDVLRFERAIAGASTAELEEAAELYTGALLPDLTDVDPAFEAWRSACQKELEERARETLAKLAEDSDRSETRRMEYARRLLGLDPYDERAHRTLIELHARRGNRRLASQHFETCRELLERELGVSPEPETVALAMSVASASDAGGPSIAVLPFRDLSPEAADSYFVDGITDEIRGALSHFRELVVFARQSSVLSAERAAGSGSAGRDLNADYLLEGTVTKLENRVRITAALIDGRTGRQLWTERYDRVVDSLFSVLDDLVQRIVGLLVERVQEDVRKRAMGKKPADMTAYDYYLRGMHELGDFHGTKEGTARARTMFEEAVRLDPDYAGAYAGLAAAYLEEYRQGWATGPERTVTLAMQFAQRAVDIDERDSLARFVLSSAYFRLKQDFARARAQIEAAIELNPNYYWLYCYKSWFSVCTGDLEDGIYCGEEAIKRNPLLPDACLWIIGYARYLAGQYQAAVSTFTRMSHHGELVLACLAASYAQLGRLDEARRYAEEYRANCREAIGSPERWRTYLRAFLPVKDENSITRLVQGLRKAGLVD